MSYHWIVLKRKFFTKPYIKAKFIFHVQLFMVKIFLRKSCLLGDNVEKIWYSLIGHIAHYMLVK